MIKRVVGILLFASLVACGGRSPSGPTHEPRFVLEARIDSLEAIVVDLRVQVDTLSVHLGRQRCLVECYRDQLGEKIRSCQCCF